MYLCIYVSTYEGGMRGRLYVLAHRRVSSCVNLSVIAMIMLLQWCWCAIIIIRTSLFSYSPAIIVVTIISSVIIILTICRYCYQRFTPPTTTTTTYLSRALAFALRTPSHSTLNTSYTADWRGVIHSVQGQLSLGSQNIPRVHSSV